MREPDVEGAWKRLLGLDVATYIIGGVLLYYGRTSLLPWLILLGYFKQIVVLDTSDRKNPSFDNWTAILTDGTKLLFMWLVYFVVLPLLAVRLVSRGLGTGFFPQIINIILELTINEEMFDISAIEMNYFIIPFWDSFSEIIPIYSLSVYAFPAAMLLYIRENSIWVAFRYKSLKTYLRSPRYAIQWIGFASLSLVGLFVLVRSGPLSYEVSRMIFRLSRGNSTLANSVDELTAFLMAVLSFQILVLAHYVLGRRETPSLSSSISSFIKQHETDITPLLLGGLLLSMGIIPATIFVLGYLSRVHNHVQSGHDGLPEFKDWKDLAVRGIRLYILWIILVSVPWTMLMLEQGAEGLLARSSAGAAAVENVLVGSTAIPVGPPVGYQLDSAVWDLLLVGNLNSLTYPPYMIGNVWNISPGIMTVFVITIPLTWVAFSLIVEAETMSRARGKPFIKAVSEVVGAIDPEYWRRLRNTTFWWIMGGIPLIGWYVWRRYLLWGADSFRIRFTSFGPELLTLIEAADITLLLYFLASLWNFYALTKAYRRLGSTTPTRNGPL